MSHQVGDDVLPAQQRVGVGSSTGAGAGTGTFGRGDVAVGQHGRQGPRHAQTQAVLAALEVLQLGHVHRVGFLLQQDTMMVVAMSVLHVEQWFPCRDRLVGLVVKASASRAEDPGFESRLRRDFFGVESYQ